MLSSSLVLAPHPRVAVLVRPNRPLPMCIRRCSWHPTQGLWRHYLLKGKDIIVQMMLGEDSPTYVLSQEGTMECEKWVAPCEAPVFDPLRYPVAVHSPDGLRW